MEQLRLSGIIVFGLLVLASCRTPPVLTAPAVTPEVHENFTLPPEPEPVHKSASGISMNGSVGAVDILPFVAGQRAVYNETLTLGKQTQQRLIEFSVVSENYNNTPCIGWERSLLGKDNKTPEIKRLWCNNYEFDFMWNNTWSLKEITTTSQGIDRDVRTKTAEDVANYTVPAGTFETLRAATRTEERVLLEWYSPGVPISGVVKLQEDRKNYHRTYELIRVEK